MLSTTARPAVDYLVSYTRETNRSTPTCKGQTYSGAQARACLGAQATLALPPMKGLLQKLRPPGPPQLGAPPTYWQLRRYCRWQTLELRRLARQVRGDVARQAQVREQAAWAEDVLRHHPLRDDLQRTLQQSADLLATLAAGTEPRTP